MLMHNSSLPVMAILILLALIPLTTCGKDSPTKPQTPEPTPPPPPPTAPVATRIEITPSSASLTSVGQTVQLIARVFDQNNAQMSSAVVTWTSSALGVATVSSQGLVTAVSNGTATITGRSGNASASVPVSVMQSAGSVVIEPSSATLMSLGETVQLTASVLDGNGQPVAGAVVEWSSSDAGVAMVSGQGLITAVGNGSVTITARSGNASASVPVSVMQSAGSVVIEPSSATLKSLGETVQLTATVLDQKGQPVADAVVIWTSSDDVVATVSGQGLVTAVKNGTATITGRSGNATASIPVTVMQSVGSIAIEPSTATLMSLGETVQLTATVLDQNRQPVSDAVVMWMSSDAGVATVSGQGLVTAVKNGTATITGRSSNATASIPVTVMQSVGSIAIEPSTATLMSLGETVQLTATVLDQNRRPVADAVVSWTSSDVGVATVSTQGLVTAVKNGTVTITVRSGSASASVLVTVMQSAGGVVIEPTSATLTSLGETVQLAASVLDGNGQPVVNAEVTWSSNDEAVAIVSAQGLVTAVSNGSVTITARSGSATASIPVTVMQSAGSVVIEPTSATLMSLGETVQLTATVLDQNGQLVADAAVSWSSSDEAVATVSGQGLVTAVSNGNVTITARSGSSNTTAEVTVLDDRVDRSVLTAFYVATKGPEWTNSANWLSAAPLGDWYGVTTNAEGRVTRLVLRENGLSGSIPPELSTMDSLQELILDSNQLSGLIPPVLGNLENLLRLSIRRNRLSGSIPPTLGNLNKLKFLDFFGNQLSGAIPGELGNLKNLQRLETCCNRLSGTIPVELSTLVDLQILDLHGNQLSGSIPFELGNLINLQWLHLNSNQLSGSIPAELGNLKKLQGLVLWNNQLSGTIPLELGNMDNLRELSLGQNRLSGLIPPALGNLLKLQWLSLDHNQLSGTIPSELGSLEKLQQLDLRSNQLAGSVPPDLENLDNLYELNLSYNQLSDSIPPELGSLDNLQKLFLHSNQLSGLIPSALGKLNNLRDLYLWSNQFSGTIPSELGSLNNLRELSLDYNNRLSGPLPAALMKTKLDYLGMSSTGLCVPSTSAFHEWRNGITVKEGVVYCGSGALIALYHATGGMDWTNHENWLSDLPLYDWYGVSVRDDGRVRVLDLTSNNMTGTLPATLGDLVHLETMDLSLNEGLAGPLPTTLVNLLDLERLQLAGTRLCTPQDPEFRDWLGGISDRSVARCGENRQDYFALAALYQSTNGPNWSNRSNWLSDSPLGSWYGVSTDAQGRVTELNLAYNNLSGSIPPELGQLVRLKTLNLENNQLSGETPPELGLLHNLTYLNLENNQMSSAIPAELGQLRDLTYLNLKWNRFVGRIPAELGQLYRLTHLNLTGNQLVGEIPRELGQLRSLAVLWLGDNRLTGSIPAELGALYNLMDLYLGSTGMTGGIPPELGQLHRLESLGLGRSQLTGDIPIELGQLRNLRELNLGSGFLTGDIPTELGQLAMLEGLYLDNNRLSGDIPAELGQLHRLLNLELNNNLLTGSIPVEFGQLYSLTRLRLSVNRLTGNVPRSLGALVNLKELDLQENVQMAGTLPSELIRMNLDDLQISGTRLCAPPDTRFQDWLRSIPNYTLGDCQRVYSGLTAYLTQATQSLTTNPVPLVAGEDALLRVFVTSERKVDATIPPVRATFYQDGAVVYTVDAPSPGSDIPGRLDEGDLASSANALIPGAVIASGLEMVIEIDRERASNTVAGIPVRMPRNGRMPIEVADVPPFDLTLVPFLWSESPDRSVLAETEDLTAESDLFRLTRDILPVREFFLSVHEPVWTSFDPSPANNWFIINETAAIRALDGASGHYMGIFRSFGGIAHTPGFVSVASLRGDVIAHELGHNMSLGHAPCSTLGDAAFPYPDGSVGAWGYDILNGVLVSPDTPDVMGYCDPDWISGFHFTKALRYRVSQEQASMAAVAFAPSARSLLLWGGVNEQGELVLEPAFAVDAPPSPPSLAGLYRIDGEDDVGSTLFSLRFGMAEIADGEGGVFAFVIPVQPNWPGQLMRITLSGPEGVATLGDEESRSAALLLDDTTGRVRGILSDWLEPDTTLRSVRRILPEPGLEVVISRGLPDPADWER